MPGVNRHQWHSESGRTQTKCNTSAKRVSWALFSAVGLQKADVRGEEKEPLRMDTKCFNLFSFRRSIGMYRVRIRNMPRLAAVHPDWIVRTHISKFYVPLSWRGMACSRCLLHAIREYVRLLLARLAVEVVKAPRPKSQGNRNILSRYAPGIHHSNRVRAMETRCRVHFPLPLINFSCSATREGVNK